MKNNIKIWGSAFITLILFSAIYYFSLYFWAHLGTYTWVQTDLMRKFLIISLCIFIPGLPMTLYIVEKKLVDDKSWFYKYLMCSAFLSGSVALIGMLTIGMRSTLSNAGGIFFDPGHTVNVHSLDGALWLFFYLVSWIPYMFGYFKENKEKRTPLQKIGLYFTVGLAIYVISYLVYYWVYYITAG